MEHLKTRKRALGLYFGLLVSVIVAMLMLRTCSSRRPSMPGQSAKAGGDTIEVAIEYSPLALVGQGDTLAGFGYEMMTAIAGALGRQVKFTPVTSFSASERAMRCGRFDVIVAEIPVTSEFRERYRFTSPVFIDRQVLVQKRREDGSLAVNTQLDLAGKRVTVIAGSTVADRIRNLSKEIGDTIFIEPDSVYSSEQLFLLVVSGDIPLAVINSGTARMLSGDYPEIDIVKSVSFNQFQSWVVNRRRSGLADSIDSAIIRYQLTPSYRRLVGKYGIQPVSRQ